MLYGNGKTEKISKLHDDQLCVNIYVKNETDDLSILGLAKNIGKNALILSNDKFRDWTEKYPGIYDEVIKNNLVDGFRFRKDSNDPLGYAFSCAKLFKKLGFVKKRKNWIQLEEPRGSTGSERNT